MAKVALLGDSVFDNIRYVLEEYSVSYYLGIKLRETDSMVLLANDGDVMDNMQSQFKKLPADVTHIFISIGGNDILPLRGRINFDSSLLEILDEFRKKYNSVIRLAKEFIDKPYFCTIYDSIPGLSDHEKILLNLFNGIIIEECVKNDCGVVDLRITCNEEQDYSSVSPIEPSEMGGLKIAHVIGEMVYDRLSGKLEDKYMEKILQ